MMSRLSRAEGRSPLPSLQSEISILNAEKYGEEPRHSRDEIVVNGKRASSSDHDDDDVVQKKRSRGRPRLDTKDETAADRRRTQIRLAQRAYRHRKDTAITTLEQKVKDLEASNEAMSKEFTKFYDIILAEGIFDIAPHAAPRLRLIADRLLRISSMVGTSSITSTESDESFVGKSAGRKSANDIAISLGSASSVIEPELTASTYSTSQHQHPAAFNYEVIAQATPNNASFPFFTSIEATSSQPQSGSYLGNSIAAPSPYPRLSPPAPFGFHERTFSKRLQRTTLERGLRLATMKNPPPEQYATVFGFCLLFESRESIIRRLAAGLKKAQNEVLDWKLSASTDQFGFLDGNFSSTVSDDLGQALLSLGKSNSAFSGLTSAFNQQSSAGSDDRTEQRIRMICQNFEGEFFTADEVEMFLRKLGVTIPPNVDYLETELDLNDLQAADEANTKSHFASIGLSPGSSGLGNGGIHSNMWQMNASSMGDFGSSLRGDSSEGQSNRMTEFSGESDPNGGLVAFMNNHDFGHMWSTGSSWPKTKVSLDVRRLIEELVGRSVCLGRVPGVRPKDVIKSVRIAAGLSTSNAP